MAQHIFKIEQVTEVDRHLPVFIGERTHAMIEVDFTQQLSRESHRGIVPYFMKKSNKEAGITVSTADINRVLRGSIFGQVNLAVGAMKSPALCLSIFNVCKYTSHIAFLQFRKDYSSSFLERECGASFAGFLC